MCHLAENLTRSWYCCQTQCNDCLEGNNITDFTCSELMNNLTDGVCMDGYYCCNYQCQTCYGYRTITESYDCNCIRIGRQRTRCDKCYRQKTIKYSYQCHCGCLQSVEQRLCNVDCGFCHEVDLNYRVSILNF